MDGRERSSRWHIHLMLITRKCPPTKAVPRLWLWLVPELAHVPVTARGEVLLRARHAPMNWGERVLFFLWLVFVAALTIGLLRQARQHRDVIAGLVVNLLVPVPMILLVLLPIQWRKFRRVVRSHLKDRN